MNKNYFSLPLLLLLLFLGACGRKGPILPPLKKIPVTLEKIRIQQVGKEIRLKWIPPDSYLDGTLMPEGGSMEVWLIVRGGIEDQEESTEARPKSYEETARRLAELPVEIGEDGIQEQSCVHIPEEEEPFLKSYEFRLRTRDAKGRHSRFSDPVKIELKVVPAAPGSLTADMKPDRIKLAWKPPGKNIDGSESPEIAGYNIYRGREDELPEKINSKPLDSPQFSDEKFELGIPFTYFVRAVLEAEKYLWESEDSAAVAIVPKDSFPPAVPEDLRSISDREMIVLNWKAVEDKDLKGYRVWRKKEGEESFTLVTPEPLPDNAYEDFDVIPGIRYYYAVSSVDESENESEKSETIMESLRGERR